MQNLSPQQNEEAQQTPLPASGRTAALYLTEVTPGNWAFTDTAADAEAVLTEAAGELVIESGPATGARVVATSDGILPYTPD